MAGLPPVVVNWLSPRKIKIEQVLAVISCLSLLLYALKITGGELLMFSLSALAGFYFLSAYLPSDLTLGIFSIIAQKLISMASSVLVIGLMFSIFKLTGGNEMMLIGFGAMVIASVILLSGAIRQWNERLTPLFIRVIVLVAFTGLVQLKLISF